MEYRPSLGLRLQNRDIRTYWTGVSQAAPDAPRRELSEGRDRVNGILLTGYVGNGLPGGRR